MYENYDNIQYNQYLSVILTIVSLQNKNTRYSFLPIGL